MTEGSVKWYMQQIFDKLGTRSRVQAVERARKLGLIN
jgi:LuxR family maltose regulon positive regulatory protein